MSPHIINISGVIGYDVTAQDVREGLAAANGGEVEAHLSTPGGLISVGLEIFNLIRDYPGPINCVLKGYAMSMGSYIPLAAPLNRFAPGKIKAEDNAIYMIHNARGGVWGDHNEIIGYGEALKGMSNMIAKAYSRRTSKPLDEVTAMMDRTTYLYGDQIKEHGFVDEVIGTGDDADEESARAQADAMFGAMVAKMIADPAQMKADLQQVALMLGGTPPTNSVSTPAAAGTIPKEVQQMNLAQLLAANPTAQAEHDALINTARAEGDAAGVARVEARINAAAPFLASDKYPPTVAATALKVVKGEVNSDTLLTVVASVDAVREEMATNAAAGASGQIPNTPAAPAPPAATNGIATDEAGLEEFKAQLKGGN